MLSAGTLIWISLRPLLRLIICVSFGFIVTKVDIFPLVAARAAAQIMLNVAMPCLMFSKIVPGINQSNISALGPLVLLGTVYLALGILIAWIIRQIFWVPHRFRYGILVAGGWSNYGDIPTSVMLSITASAPFGGPNDQNLSVAYIAALLLFWTITFFPCGGHQWIAKDFIGPDVENDEVREKIQQKRRYIAYGWISNLRARGHSRPSRDLEHSSETKTGPSIDLTPSVKEDLPRPSLNPKSTLSAADTQAATAVEEENAESSPPAHRYMITTRTWLKTIFMQLMTPPSLSVLVSFVIAVIPKVKALFLPVQGVYMPTAPDGQPPLAFVTDAANFVGAASVPLGLICLGSALARLSVPHSDKWRDLPIGAILSLAAVKMIVFPVLGVLITRGLANGGIIDSNDKVLVFVCIFFSCLPTATTQVYVTQAYSPTGSAEHIPAFLIPQYALMMISMVALNIYALHTLF